MPKIRKLTVNNFRGIRESSLEIDGCSLVLLGENGTGKSSYIDALEFYFTGNVGHLEGAQGVSTFNHAPHIRSSSDDVSVTIEFEDPCHQSTRTFQGLTQIASELVDYHELGKNAKFILRRKNLLDFILAQPSKRYEQLAAIIGVNDLDRVERALMQTRDELDNKVETLNTLIQSEKDKLSNLIGIVDQDDSRVLEAVNHRLSDLGQLPLASFDEVEERKLIAVLESRSPLDTRRIVDIQSVLTLATSINSGLFFIKEHRKLWNEVEDLQINSAQMKEALFQEVLLSSRRLLNEYSDINCCPVCQRAFDREDILDALEKRIQNAQVVIEKFDNIKRLRNDLIAKVQEYQNQINNLIDRTREIDFSWKQSKAKQYLVLLSNLVIALQVEPNNLKLRPLDDLCSELSATGFDRAIGDLSIALNGEMNRLEPTDQDKKTVNVIDLLTRVMDSRNSLKELNPKLKTKQAVQCEISTIYNCFVNTKRIEIQRIYQELEGDIKKFLNFLHPNEGYQEVLLEVNEDRRASTEIKMDFHDRPKEDPRAFNSEGHLDSLGLCIFLAFAKRFNMEFPILCLDDVVSSIDSRHRQRICKLLFDEFPCYQFFITTHDYIWFEELRAYQRAHGQEHLFRNMQILDWSLESGPRLDKYKPRWERIQEKLSGADKDGAAGDIRKEIEAFLLEAAISMCTPITLKRDGKYTVADLYDPLVARVKRLIPEFYQANLTIFQDLKSDGIFGNLLVHNNPRAENASLEEVKRFAEVVENFEKQFTCPNCKSFIVYYRDAKIVRCGCGKNGVLFVTKE